MVDKKTPGGVAKFVAQIVKDPKSPPDCVMLTGYLGSSSEDGHTRLYFDPNLSNYVEIPNDAILHTEPFAQDSLGASHVWIKRDAVLTYGPAGSQRPKGSFLEGPIMQQHLAAAAAGAGGAGAGQRENTYWPCTLFQCGPHVYQPQIERAQGPKPSVQVACPSWIDACPTRICPPTATCATPTCTVHCPTLPNGCTYGCPTHYCYVPTPQLPCPTSQLIPCPTPLCPTHICPVTVKGNCQAPAAAAVNDPGRQVGPAAHLASAVMCRSGLCLPTPQCPPTPSMVHLCGGTGFFCPPTPNAPCPSIPCTAQCPTFGCTLFGCPTNPLACPPTPIDLCPTRVCGVSHYPACPSVVFICQHTAVCQAQA